MTLKAAIQSMRLRTLPLSLSGIVLGALLAIGTFPQITVSSRLWTLVFLVLTTLSLQILSNLSNELGDVLRGTDTAERQGPQYGLNSGAMTVRNMKVLIGVFIALCLVFGTLMIRFSFGTLLSLNAVLMFLLGCFAVKAAMSYTLGPNPYGYRAMGDVYVFLFFGLVAVYGAYFIVSGDATNFAILLPGAAIGCFSVGVLNVNNIRDMKTDAENRLTVAIKMGPRKARIYQTVLIVAGWVLLAAFFAWDYGYLARHGVETTLGWRQLIWVVTLPLYTLHLRGVWSRDGRALDPMLPLLVLSTFLLSCLAGWSYLEMTPYSTFL